MSLVAAGLLRNMRLWRRCSESCRTRTLPSSAFPATNLARRSPARKQQIVQFCQTQFDVTFPMSSKLDVNGANRHPLYKFLTSPDTGVSGDITWNFEKFLIGRDGKVLKRYPPQTKPQDSGVMEDIAAAL